MRILRKAFAMQTGLFIGAGFLFLWFCHPAHAQTGKVKALVDREVGTISEGKYADIIAVRGDVLRYINLLQDVDLVMKHGRLYK